MISDGISDISQQPPQRSRGRPFPKGVSPCPGGARGLRKRALAEEQARLEAFHGRPAEPQELDAIDALVSARLVKPRNAADALKRSSTILKASATLYGPTGKPQPAHIPLRERWARELAEADSDA